MQTENHILKTYNGYMQTKEFGEGDKKVVKIICTASDDSPLYAAIRECHEIAHCLPNDWIYMKCAQLLRGMEEYSQEGADLEEASFEIVDACVDIYNHDLFDWAKKFSFFVEEAKQEGMIGVLEDVPIERQLMSGQFQQLDHMYNILLEAVRTEVSNSELVAADQC